MNTKLPPIQRGVNFGFYARNGYFGSAQARTEVDRMTRLRAAE